MADAIVSIVAERVVAILEEQIRKQVNLVRGIDKELQSLSQELKTVRQVLDDAEKKGFKDKRVKNWLKRLEDMSYDMDDVLDEWNMEILKLEIQRQSDANVRSKVHSCILSPCLFFKKVAIRRDIANKVENAKAKLDLILREKDRYDFMITSQPPTDESWRVQSTSLIDLEEVCGRNFESENLVRKLVGEEGSSRREDLGVRVFSIVGVGGLGKTTLAKLAYNDNRVEKYFDKRIWICVSDPFNEVEIAKGILGIVTNENSLYTNQLEILLRRVKESISGKKFLLVMDDVWTEDDTKWEPLKSCLKCGGVGSKILVTTRNVGVAVMMGTAESDIHRLGELSDDECWLLLGRIALSGKNKEELEKFEGTGRNIAKKCRGLPLAAKTLGGLLRFKHTLAEWESVLNSEIWELEKAEVELFPHLLLSYNELSPALKRCFSYCALFPKDTHILVESLISKWMALGYLESDGNRAGEWELKGREYFDKLAMRSLFQDFHKYRSHLDDHEVIISFKMHDILHDFARFLWKDAGEVGAAAAGTKERSFKTTSSSPLLISHAREFRNLFFRDEIPPLDPYELKSLRLLTLENCGLRSIPKKMEKLIHLRWLNLGQNEFGAEDVRTICRLYNLKFLWLNSCSLTEIPIEIGNLIQLKLLDLSYNESLQELPESFCCLRELESLNIERCSRLSGLPQGIERLINFKHLSNDHTDSMEQFPQRLAELTSLRTLTCFRGGINGNKLGWLKNLNQLNGFLRLIITLSNGNYSEEMVGDARDAELSMKTQLRQLIIEFGGARNEVRDSVWVDLIAALKPHRNLRWLQLGNYQGSRLPGWIASPLNQLRSITLEECKNLPTLPPLGKLPLLEEFQIYVGDKLEFVGREFMGTTREGDDHDMDIHVASSSSSSSCLYTSIGFPKLQTLAFVCCENWKEWEDISAEEEHSALVSLMPCLTELHIINCKGLSKLPHRLMRKASSLKVLEIEESTQLQQVYGDKEGEAWKSISLYNPHLELGQF